MVTGFVEVLTVQNLVCGTSETDSRKIYIQRNNKRALILEDKSSRMQNLRWLML